MKLVTPIVFTLSMPWPCCTVWINSLWWRSCRQLPLDISDWATHVSSPLSRTAARSSHMTTLSI